MPDPVDPELALLPLPPGVRADIARRWTESRFEDEWPLLRELVERARAGDRAAVDELEDAFSGPLPIGTGGRRGTCGVGPNRMNPAVLRETAEGLVRAIEQGGWVRRVAIVYDTRRDSRRFARIVADHLARLGVHATLVDEPRPTPLLSFLVRHLGCGAGVVISASHNPPNDNGIKIYGPDGAQVIGARDEALMGAIEAAAAAPLSPGAAEPDALEVLATPEALARVDEPYFAEVLRQGVTDRDLGSSGLRVVYSPFHGVGHTAVLPVLARRGLVPQVVEAQLPDGGRFTTLPSANPEQPEAFALARGLTDDADLVLANDPDADRLGALARDARGDLVFIDGNRLGVLLLDHVLRHAAVPPNGWVLSTIVTTPLVATLARAQGVEVVDDLLVGFKHHAGMVEERPDRVCVFACEESHGYLRGQNVRDKDGIIAALLLCEAAAEAKVAGRRLLARLDELWVEHGYHRERTANVFAPGVSGREAIATWMEAWRSSPPERFGEARVRAVEDRRQPRATGSATRDLLGNVLIFELEPWGGVRGRVVVRPSGTEPKAKIYALLHADPAPFEALLAVQEEVDRATESVSMAARDLAEPWMRPRVRGS